MAYFPHAYKKMFLAKAVEVASGTSSEDLAKGEVALLDKSFSSVAPGSVSANGLYTLAQGSLHSVDKIGPFHGGYQESVKSKGINPKFISKLWEVEVATATSSVAKLATIDGAFEGGKSIFVRVDVKGSPALRFLGRNAYFVSDYTVKCADGATVDASKVLLDIAAEMANDPLVSPFVAVSVEQWDPAAASGAGDWVTITTENTNDEKCRLVVEGAYVDTKFGDCSFRPTDFFEKEPVQIFLSELNETGDICAVDFQDPHGATDSVRTDATQGSGFGETVIRDFILSNRYAQEPYNNDPRMREVSDAIAFEVDRTASYKLFNILHSIPRSYNPSGMHNSDQYLLTIAVDNSDTASKAAMSSILDALETASGVAKEVY
jgi:hypothetical protein